MKKYKILKGTWGYRSKLGNSTWEEFQVERTIYWPVQEELKLTLEFRNCPCPEQQCIVFNLWGMKNRNDYILIAFRKNDAEIVDV